MLVATWIAAVSGAILAVSGPVALFAWLGARRQDRMRRQAEREEEARSKMMETARSEFVPKSWVTSSALLGAILGGLGLLAWLDSKTPPRQK